LCPEASLASLLHAVGFLDEVTSAWLVADALNALAFLHGKGIVHRDIKGANLLIHQGILKLCDFGAAIHSFSKHPHRSITMGTLLYMPPETLTKMRFGSAMDIWATGCVALEMLALNKGTSVQDAEFLSLRFMHTASAAPSIPQNLSRTAQDFLGQCLRRNPNLRPTAAELLEHQFIVKTISSGVRTLRPDVAKVLQKCSGRWKVELGVRGQHSGEGLASHCGIATTSAGTYSDTVASLNSAVASLHGTRKGVAGSGIVSTRSLGEGDTRVQEQGTLKGIEALLRRLTFEAVFENPVVEDAFHGQFQAARLAVARGTGQWINVLGFLVNAMTWLQDAPSRVSCLICILIFTAATPINYLPFRQPDLFVQAIYRPITRLCACFVGFMPEKHFLFAALHQGCVAVACHGSSLPLIETAFYLMCVCLTQLCLRTFDLWSSFQAICACSQSHTKDASMQSSISSALVEFSVRFVISIGSFVTLFAVIRIQRKSERARFVRYLREMNGIDGKFVSTVPSSR
jgi:hypothetical protein